MMKNLVTLDPLLETPVSAIKLYRPVAVHRDTTLMDMLKLFQVRVVLTCGSLATDLVLGL